MFATQLRPLSTACPSPDAGLCDRIARIAEQGPGAVNRRLAELTREWTVGRWVKALCGLTLVGGLVLTLTVGPWWLLLAGVGGATLMQYLFFKHSVMGWLLTAAGVRPGSVIDDERLALRVLRGDFKCLPTLGQVHDHDAISRMMDDGGPALDDDDDKLPSRQVAVLITAGTRQE
jgi:hypothetical protein